MRDRMNDCRNGFQPLFISTPSRGAEGSEKISREEGKRGEKTVMKRREGRGRRSDAKGEKGKERVAERGGS